MSPLEHETLRERVVGAIKTYIVENSLGCGDRIPSEQDLARQLAVGRSSVREALKSLEGIGMIESHPKLGCLIKAVDLGDLAAQIPVNPTVSGVTFDELLEAREFLVTNILPEVVRRKDPATVLALADWLRKAEEAAAGEGDWASAEKGFHAALFRGVGNAVLESFAEVIEGFMGGWKSLLPGFVPEPARWLEYHRMVFQAVLSGDVPLARGLVQSHLKWYSEVFPHPASSLPRRTLQVA